MLGDRSTAGIPKAPDQGGKIQSRGREKIPTPGDKR